MNIMNMARCAALVMLARTAGAQARSKAATTSDTVRTREEVMALEQRVGTANLSCDYAFFARVEAPEFIFTDSRGAVTTRAEDLAGASSCRPKKGTYLLDDIRMQYHGAVVVLNARATTTVFRDTVPPAV